MYQPETTAVDFNQNNESNAVSLVVLYLGAQGKVNNKLQSGDNTPFSYSTGCRIDGCMRNGYKSPGDDDQPDAIKINQIYEYIHGITINQRTPLFFLIVLDKSISIPDLTEKLFVNFNQKDHAVLISSNS